MLSARRSPGRGVAVRLCLLRSSCVGMAPFSYVARGARLLRQMRCAHPPSAGYCHSPTSTVGRTVTENCIHRARDRSPRIAALAPSLPFSAPGLGVIESHNGRIWVTGGRLNSRCANSSPGPRREYWRISIPECGGSNPPEPSQSISNASHMKVAQKPRDRSAASGDLMKTLLGAFIWPTPSRASIYRARPCRADRCRRMDRALRRRGPGLLRAPDRTRRRAGNAGCP